MAVGRVWSTEEPQQEPSRSVPREPDVDQGTEDPGDQHLQYQAASAWIKICRGGRRQQDQDGCGAICRLPSDACLSDACLSDACLSDACLSDACLSDACLSDACLSDAFYPRDAQPMRLGWNPFSKTVNVAIVTLHAALPSITFAATPFFTSRCATVPRRRHEFMSGSPAMPGHQRGERHEAVKCSPAPPAGVATPAPHSGW